MKNKTSRIRLLDKAFKISLINLWRNKMLSFATIFVIGIIIFIFNIILAVNYIAADALTNISQKIDIVVYLKESTSLQDIQKVNKEIQQLEGVLSVVYTSKEDAIKKLKTLHPDLTLAFEKYDLGNPLPASISISTVHPKYHESIASFINQDKYSKYFTNISSNNDLEEGNILNSVSKNLLELTTFANQVIFWLIITFIIGGALIIINALQITIYSRKKEISVMKMVGASYWFIRLPFILESIMYGIFAIIISFVLLFALSKNMEIPVLNIKFHIIFFTEIAFTIILSIMSSLIAVHEHLK